MALLSRPWIVTPPDGFTINWGHPLTRGLVEVIVSPRFGKRSAVNNVVPGGTLASSSYGFGAGGGGTQFADNTTDKLTYAGGWSQRSAGFTLLTDYVLTATRAAARTIAGNFLSNVGGYVLAPNSTNYRAFTARAGGTDSIVGTAAVVGKRKSDVLIVGAGGSNFYYENGILSGSVARLGYVAPSGVPFTIGADNGANVTGSSIVFSAMMWNRELSAAEIRSISANPYQILTPVRGLAKWGLLVSSGITHAATGALTGQGSTVAGASARFRAFDASGALVGQGSALSGAALLNPLHTSSGALVGQGAAIAGSAARSGAAVVHDATGGLIGSGAIITGQADLPSTAPTIINAGPIWHPWGKKTHRRETEEELPPAIVEARQEVVKTVETAAKLAIDIAAMERKFAADLAESVSRATIARREKAQVQRKAKLAKLESHVAILNDRLERAVAAENERIRQRDIEEADIVYVMHMLMEA